MENKIFFLLYRHLFFIIIILIPITFCYSETSNDELVTDIIISLIVKKNFIETERPLIKSDFSFSEKTDSVSYSINVITIKGYKDTILLIIDNISLIVLAIYKDKTICLLNGEPSPAPWGNSPACKEWIFEVMLSDNFHFIKE